jgi:hypothetical protein
MNEEILRRGFRDVPTARLATIGAGATPHVAPVWFVWREDAIYLSTAIGSATWENAARHPRVGLVIDRGRDWTELVGVQVEGNARLLPVEHPDMRSPMSAWHEKYRSMFAGDAFERFTRAVPALGFLRVEPGVVHVWNHAASDGAIAGLQAPP